MRTARLLIVAALAACGSSPGTNTDAGHGGDDGGGSGSDGGDTPPDAASCGEIIATLRDFKAEHPDFEDTTATDRGLVREDLGADGKPVYAHAGVSPAGTVSGPASFDQWYRDVPNVNLTFSVPLTLVEGPTGTFTFEDNEFFPLDGMGFPNTEVQGHNFHFTTEIHGTFTYRGGEVFTFTGDDDVFIFVNDKLALDLGGVHAVQEATIDFDQMAGALGITTGNTYKIDVFHAERHTGASNFKMTTTIDCLVVIE